MGNQLQYLEKMKTIIISITFILILIFSLDAFNQELTKYEGEILVVECNLINGVLIFDTLHSCNQPEYFILKLNNLNEANIKELPTDYFKANELELVSDTLTDVDAALTNFIHIEFLRLNGKGVVDFPERLKEMKHLSRLAINNTSIRKIPKSFKNIKLGEFYFANNSLRKIPRWFYHVQISDIIRFENNDIYRITSSIFHTPALFLYIIEPKAKFTLRKSDIQIVGNKEAIQLTIVNSIFILEQLRKQCNYPIRTYHSGFSIIPDGNFMKGFD